MNRLCTAAVAILAAVSALLLLAGLIRGAVPQSSETGSSTAEPITVAGGYLRPPLPPTDLAAAYFTVYNNSRHADTLQSVATGDADGTVIPAHGKLTLSTGKGHVMIGQIYGRLRAGQNVNIELQFRDAGPIEVVAPVIAYGSPAPGAAEPSTEENHSGAHS